MNIFIFTGGEAPSPETAKPFFEKCKPDYVIAADSGLETLDLYAEDFGEDFAPNLILGDMDSLKNLSLLEKYKNAKRALSTAREICKTASVVLVGGNGGCLDHLISIYDSFSEDFHADVWLCVNQAVYFLAEKKSAEVFNLQLEDRISVSRLTDNFDNSFVEAEGFEWNCFRKKGMASVSNRISKENFLHKNPAKLFAKKGSFLIFAPYHCEVKI